MGLLDTTKETKKNTRLYFIIHLHGPGARLPMRMPVYSLVETGETLSVKPKREP